MGTEEIYGYVMGICEIYGRVVDVCEMYGYLMGISEIYGYVIGICYWWDVCPCDKYCDEIYVYVMGIGVMGEIYSYVMIIGYWWDLWVHDDFHATLEGFIIFMDSSAVMFVWQVQAHADKDILRISSILWGWHTGREEDQPETGATHLDTAQTVPLGICSQL